MKTRKFHNSMELWTGQILTMTQFYQYQPASTSYPEEWEGEEPVFRIEGRSISREDVSEILSTKELEEFIDSAVEDADYSPPRSDEEHLL